MRIDDRHPAAHLPDCLYELHHVRRIQVIENSQAQDDVERPIVLIEMADVIEDECEVVQRAHGLDEPSLRQVRIASLDGENLGPAESELNSVLSLQARQVEDAKGVERLSSDISGNLHEPPQSRVLVRFIEGIQLACEVNAPRGPRTDPLLNFLLLSR